MTTDDNQLFEQYLASNRQAFGKRAVGPKHVVYVDCAADEAALMNATLRIAASFAHINQGELYVMGTGRDVSRHRRISGSFGAKWTTTTYRTMLSGLIRKPVGVWRCFNALRTRSQLVRFKLGKAAIGKHIYDTLLRRHGLPRIVEFSFKRRAEIAAEVCFFFGLEALFDRHRPKFAILGDNTYRLGLAFELVRRRNIPSLVGINLQGVAAHFYRRAEDYEFHCRAPDPHLVQTLGADPLVQDNANQALTSRTSGAESQHDVVRAYAPGKIAAEADTLRRHLGVPPDKKLVVVMAHIFQDAPHAYPGAHFDDYADWLVRTCQRLLQNDAVHLVVKEHPSVDLYGEQNAIDAVLEDLAPETALVVKDINTRSFFSAADAIVTCGGTCGLEFPCFGVPVIVAARPPYAGFPHIYVPNSQAEYFFLLDRIQTLPRLDAEMVRLARTIFYVLNNVNKVDRRLLGLGTQAPGLGSTTDLGELYREMIQLNGSDEAAQALADYLGQIWNSSSHNFITPEYLHLHNDTNQHLLPLVPRGKCPG